MNQQNLLNIANAPKVKPIFQIIHDPNGAQSKKSAKETKWTADEHFRFVEGKELY